MSPFLSMKFHETRGCHPLWGWIRGMIGVVVGLVASQGSAQFSPDIRQQINQAITDGDFHAVSLAVGAWESRASEAGDDQKLPYIKEAINFAAAIFEKCDPSLHSSFNIGPEPPFDWRKYGIKPLFSGEQPEAIEDPVAREAYKRVLADHRKLMVRVSAERQRLEEADYCARAAFRVVESSSNRTALSEAVEKHIATIQEAQWIKARLTQIVLPKPPSKEQTPTQTDSTAPASTSQPQPRAAAPSLSLSSVQTPASKKAPEAMPEPPSEKPASSTPWSIIAVLIVAGCGLLWLLLKRRS